MDQLHNVKIVALIHARIRALVGCRIDNATQDPVDDQVDGRDDKDGLEGLLAHLGVALGGLGTGVQVHPRHDLSIGARRAPVGEAALRMAAAKLAAVAEVITPTARRNVVGIRLIVGRRSSFRKDNRGKALTRRHATRRDSDLQGASARVNVEAVALGHVRGRNHIDGRRLGVHHDRDGFLHGRSRHGHGNVGFFMLVSHDHGWEEGGGGLVVREIASDDITVNAIFGACRG